MISPNEIKKQCEKWWKNMLLSELKKEAFFPKEVRRIGKPTVKYIRENYPNYVAETQLLSKHSKNQNTKKGGYTLYYKEINSSKIGKQKIIDKIQIDSKQDYLAITKKQNEYLTFRNNLTTIQQSLPILEHWTFQNPLKLISHTTWEETLKVCHYFLENARPNLYIRELPIDVHTKYISENRSLIESLLVFLLEDKLDNSMGKSKNEREFCIKFSLLYDQHKIRLNFLDENLAINNLKDISIPISDFKTLKSTSKYIFVTENIKNFLTLPKLKNAIALWSGGGFSVSYLKDIAWLKNKQFIYWGDLDAQGFHILNQFRSYFPTTIALMMNQKTLEQFENHIREGKETVIHSLPHLIKSELELYHYLQKNNLRLEQEHISQSFTNEEIRRMLLLV